jgi:hypothetical protein
MLVDNKLYLNSSPGDTSKVGLKPMGFITKLHPKTASLTAAHYDLEACIQEAIDDADDNILLELGVTNNKLAVSLASDRLRGVFREDKITSNGVVVFSEAKDMDRNFILLEHFSEGMWVHGHVFVPFSLRRKQPEVYGQYLALQNVFLKDHRNISLCGIGPEVLDYEAHPTTEDSYTYSDSIWRQLSGLPGVYRVDPTKRTSDLGKWNLSCDAKNYLDITAWIDTNLLPLFRKVPSDIRAQYTFKDFNEPARLNRNFRADHSNNTVRSSMTGTASRYQQSLVSHLSNYTALPTVERNPWQSLTSRPMKEIKYTHEDSAFPHLKTSNDTKSTAAETTADMTNVSAVTDSVIHVAVKDAFEALQKEHKELEKQWQTKFDKLEAKMEDLSKSVASDVITAMLQSENMPFLNKTDFFAQMTSQTSAMTAIMEASNSKVNDIKTMFTSIEATLRDGQQIKSPPRNKQRTLQDPMNTNLPADTNDPLPRERVGESK